MPKYATVYSIDKPMSVAHDAIAAKCNYVLNSFSYDEDNLRQFMGTYLYCGFNVVKEENRYDNLRLSIKDLCMNVGGLLALSMNDILTAAGDVASEKKIRSERLVTILQDEMLYEINTLLGLSDLHEDIYKALVRMLFTKDNKVCTINAATPMKTVEELLKKEYNQMEVLCG